MTARLAIMMRATPVLYAPHSVTTMAKKWKSTEGEGKSRPKEETLRGVTLTTSRRIDCCPPLFEFWFETCGCLSNNPLPSLRSRASESELEKAQSKPKRNTNPRVGKTSSIAPLCICQVFGTYTTVTVNIITIVLHSL